MKRTTTLHVEHHLTDSYILCEYIVSADGRVELRVMSEHRDMPSLKKTLANFLRDNPKGRCVVLTEMVFPTSDW